MGGEPAISRSAIQTGWYCHGNFFNAMTCGRDEAIRPRARFLKTATTGLCEAAATGRTSLGGGGGGGGGAVGENTK
jgi:hypothetical protein